MQLRMYRQFIAKKQIQHALRLDDKEEIMKHVFSQMHILKKICYHPLMNLPEEKQQWKKDYSAQKRGEEPEDYRRKSNVFLEDDGADETKEINIYDQEPDDVIELSNKFKLIKEMVQGWRRLKKKFLVFAFSKVVLKLLDYSIFNEDEGFAIGSVAMINGDVKQDDRTKILEKFSKGELDGILITKGVLFVLYDSDL